MIEELTWVKQYPFVPVRCIAEYPLELQCPLDNARHFPPKRTGNGVPEIYLHRLPLEIQEMVLSCLDLYTITTLRAVNRSTRQHISNQPQYSALITHAPQLLRALLSTQLAHCFTLADALNRVVSHMRCAFCSGDYASLVYCPTLSRVCHPCSIADPRVNPSYLRDVSKHYGLDTMDVISTVPVMKTLPGNYEPCFKRKERIELVDPITIRNIPGASQQQQLHPPVTANRLIAEDGRELQLMAVVSVPESTSNEVPGGLRCKGCRDTRKSRLFTAPRSPLDVTRAFTKAGYIKHIEECPATQARIRMISECASNDVNMHIL